MVSLRSFNGRKSIAYVLLAYKKVYTLKPTVSLHYYPKSSMLDFLKNFLNFRHALNFMIVIL